MISDMVAIQDFEVAFQLGQPFLPFQQLLGVLPSASFKLLPEPYQVGIQRWFIHAFIQTFSGNQVQAGCIQPRDHGIANACWYA